MKVRNRIAMVSVLAMMLGLASCGNETSVPDCSFEVDATRLGNEIPNLVSNVNVWSVGESFINPKVTSEVNIFDFVEYVQLMTATGGSPSRDLFKDPLDRTVKDDYAFDNLVANCRGILSLGAKPHLKLGNVPVKFTSRYRTDLYGVNIFPPDDYGEYYTYIRALMEVLVSEFGIDEVRTWHFGVFTEYENKEWFQGSDGTPETAAEDFCKIYDWTVQAVTDVLGEDVWIGAHSMTVNEGLWDEAIFIEHCAQGRNWANGGRGTHITYLASSYYDYSPGRFSDKKSLPECIAFLRTTAEKYGLTDLKFGIDEGRILGSAPGKNNDAVYSRTVGFTYMAAYDACRYGQMLDAGGDYLSSWQYLSTDLLEGNPSVSCHVAMNINRMAGMKRAEVAADSTSACAGDLEMEVKAFAGVDTSSGKITIMVYNFGNSLDYDSTVVARLNVRTSMRRGSHRIQIRKVDDDCNWFDEWVEDRKALGITDDMFNWSPDDACHVPWNIIDETALEKYMELVPKYAECSVLTPLDDKVHVSGDGLAVIDCILSPNSVWFIDIR